MMAASWRNLTLSSSEAPSLRVFTATFILSFEPGTVHSPKWTLPNWPAPNSSVNLIRRVMYNSYEALYSSRQQTTIDSLYKDIPDSSNDILGPSKEEMCTMSP